MFGSNFFANFGIPEFSGIDPQGGIFGPTAGQPPTGQPGPQSLGQAAGPDLPGGPAAPAAQPATPPPGGAASALSPGPLSPGASPQPQPEGGSPAPAAGVASPFGRPNV